MKIYIVNKLRNSKVWHTKRTLSLAANASISAHETVPLQTLSRRFFALSMTSNPLKLGLFGGALFSALLFAVESISTEPSAPC